ncbi:DNA topoisomerase 3 [Vibrio sp. WXL103]|uniref:DNA topoisomerase 3 n=1 Tax=Vibrio sp. WXL103 TaxID=3450710 RepID=UPI003EC51042
MQVYIAEKPSLAAAIFKGLGGNPQTGKKDGYYQTGSNVVTWCVGHLLALNDPEDYDPALKKWSLEQLPITTVFPPKLKPRKGVNKQLNTVVSLVKKASSIVHAGDPDAEGQLLVDEVLRYAGNDKKVERVLIADLNDKPVKKALANLQCNTQFANLSDKALARSLADQAFGYNLTRAYTLKAREKGYDSVLNIGRVITTLIGLVNVRTLANQNHTKSYYYELVGQFKMGDHELKAKLVPDDSFDLDERRRMISSLEAAATKEADKGQAATVNQVSEKTETTAPPMPFNLSKLQIEASKKWGYNPKQTLDVLQGLYEKHKLVTYPRSDNQFLSDAHLANTPQILAAVSGTSPELDRVISEAQPTSTHKAFNAAKIEAHHAIIPTEKNGASITLNEKERNIYELIAKRFIALFYPPSVRNKVTLDIQCTDRLYRSTQTTLESQGWEVLFKAESRDEPNENSVDLATLTEGQTGECVDVEILERETKPPKYFDDASLLTAMTNAAKFIKDPALRKQLEAKDKNTKGENGSIGTEATRSGHIEKLGSLKHLVSVKKVKGYKNPVYMTTKAGQEFCALLPDEIVMPDTSAIWEGDLSRIEGGECRVTEFIDRIDTYLAEQIAHVKTHGIALTQTEGITCPTCQKGRLKALKGRNGPFWACVRFPDCKTAFPDDNGKPNLNPKKKQSGEVSKDEFCKRCGKALVRRPGKREGSFWWGCSGFPTCKVRFFDQNGKPDRDRGELE